MEIFKQLKKLGYKHYIGLTIEELETLPVDSIEKKIEYSLVIDWFIEKYKINTIITIYNRHPLLVGFGEEIRYYWIIVYPSEYGGYTTQSQYPCNQESLHKTYQEAREQAILKVIELLEISTNIASTTEM